jgi:prolyl oligopeptidase
MAARMEEQGHRLFYYENIEGGHGAAANLEQTVHRLSLINVFLYQELFDQP